MLNPIQDLANTVIPNTTIPNEVEIFFINKAIDIIIDFKDSDESIETFINCKVFNHKLLQLIRSYDTTNDFKLLGHITTEFSTDLILASKPITIQSITDGKYC